MCTLLLISNSQLHTGSAFKSLRFQTPQTVTFAPSCMPCCGSGTTDFSNETVGIVRIHELAAAVVADRLRRSLEHCPESATEYVTASYAESFKLNEKRFANAAEKSGKGGSGSEPTFAPIVKALKRQVEESGLKGKSKRDKGVLDSLALISKHFTANELDAVKKDLKLQDLWRDIGYACRALGVKGNEDSTQQEYAVFPAAKRAPEGLNTLSGGFLNTWRARQRRPGPVPVGKHIMFAAPIHPGLLWTYDQVYNGGQQQQQQQQTAPPATTAPTAVQVQVETKNAVYVVWCSSVDITLSYHSLAVITITQMLLEHQRSNTGTMRLVNLKLGNKYIQQRELKFRTSVICTLVLFQSYHAFLLSRE